MRCSTSNCSHITFLTISFSPLVRGQQSYVSTSTREQIICLVAFRKYNFIFVNQVMTIAMLNILQQCLPSDKEAHGTYSQHQLAN